MSGAGNGERDAIVIPVSIHLLADFHDALDPKNAFIPANDQGMAWRRILARGIRKLFDDHGIEAKDGVIRIPRDLAEAMRHDAD